MSMVVAHIFLKAFVRLTHSRKFDLKRTISLEITASQIFFDMGVYKLTATFSDSYFPII